MQLSPGPNVEQPIHEQSLHPGGRARQSKADSLPDTPPPVMEQYCCEEHIKDPQAFKSGWVPGFEPHSDKRITKKKNDNFKIFLILKIKA